MNIGEFKWIDCILLNAERSPIAITRNNIHKHEFHSKKHDFQPIGAERLLVKQLRFAQYITLSPPLKNCLTVHSLHSFTFASLRYSFYIQVNTTSSIKLYYYFLTSYFLL